MPGQAKAAKVKEEERSWEEYLFLPCWVNPDEMGRNFMGQAAGQKASSLGLSEYPVSDGK